MKNTKLEQSNTIAEKPVITAKAVEGPFLLSARGNIHRHGTINRTQIDTALLIEQVDSQVYARVEDAASETNKSKTTKVSVHTLAEGHYVREASDGTFRLHRHATSSSGQERTPLVGKVLIISGNAKSLKAFYNKLNPKPVKKVTAPKAKKELVTAAVETVEKVTKKMVKKVTGAKGKTKAVENKTKKAVTPKTTKKVSSKAAKTPKALPAPEAPTKTKKTVATKKSK